MVKAKWGTKRACQSCGARFYDLRRHPIVCPKCGAHYDPDAVQKMRRSRALPAEATAARPLKAPKPEVKPVPVPELPEEVEAVPVESEEEEEETLIEDTSELGEDEDDVAEVIENVDQKEEG